MVLNFRAFDKESKLIREVVAIYFGESAAELHIKDGENPEYKKLNKIILMQSTGLYDINNVEIFEGDILSRQVHVWIYGRDSSEWITEKYPVVCRDGTCRINGEILGDVLEEGIREDGLRQTGVQIIGNIHQNKDLLEQTDK